MLARDVSSVLLLLSSSSSSLSSTRKAPMLRCQSQNAPKKKTWDDSTTFTAKAFRPFCATTMTTSTRLGGGGGGGRRRRVGDRAKEDVAPGVVVFASRFWDSDSGRQRRATTRSPMPDADEEEGSVLDLPEEYVRAVPSRRPDIFPDLKEIKQPMPNPLPGDPEMPDEEEEEQERKENPGEPGEDEEEDENGEKISKKEKKRREKEEENEE